MKLKDFKLNFKPLSKDSIPMCIADILPDRIILWAIVRIFGYTSTHECSNKSPEQIGYSDCFKSWENKLKK